MKRLLLPLLAALALPTAINAGVDPEVHNLCKDVKDYMGCVQANSKKDGWNPFKKTAKDKPKNSFQLTNPEKAKLDSEAIKQRCSKGREESMKLGKIGIIENYESCTKFLNEIGATSLDIPLKVHQKCENLLFYNRKVEPYLYCASNETTWEPPTKYSRDEIVKSYRKYSCEVEDNLSSAPAGFWDGDSCVRRKVPDVVTYKGKTYTASRICDSREKMRWNRKGRKLYEIGCMTAKEYEAYARAFNQRKNERERQQLKEALNDFGKAINPPTVYCDSFDYGSGISTTCKQY